MTDPHFINELHSDLQELRRVGTRLTNAAISYWAHFPIGRYA